MKLSSEQAITLSILGLGLMLYGCASILGAAIMSLFPESYILYIELGFCLMLYAPLRKIKFSLSVISLVLCLYNSFHLMTPAVRQYYIPLFAVLAIVAFVVDLIPIIKKKKATAPK